MTLISLQIFYYQNLLSDLNNLHEAKFHCANISHFSGMFSLVESLCCCVARIQQVTKVKQLIIFEKKLLLLFFLCKALRFF